MINHVPSFTTHGEIRVKGREAIPFSDVVHVYPALGKVFVNSLQHQENLEVDEPNIRSIQDMMRLGFFHGFVRYRAKNFVRGQYVDSFESGYRADWQVRLKPEVGCSTWLLGSRDFARAAQKELRGW